MRRIIGSLNRYFKNGIILFLFLTFSNSLNAQTAPTLPKGLLDNKSTNASPALPPGLKNNGVSKEPDDSSAAPMPLPFDLTAFCELRTGRRLHQGPNEQSTSLSESRLQIEIERQWTNIGFKLTSDFIYDTVLSRNRIRLDSGEGWLDLREANIYFSPAEFIDVKIGRQIMTWGTGDMIFINDLFSKDWNSYLIGRDNEYLKAPTDAFKISFFNTVANIDIYYTPYFMPDRYIDGRRISYWNNFSDQRAGRNMIIRPDQPSTGFKDDETGFRVFKNIKGYELALYGYAGFWKSPAGTDITSNKPIFPDLNVLGASLRGKFLNGIANIEFGYYDSHNDRSGKDPFIRNSEIRLLLGYEEEVSNDFTIGIQYYIENMRRHDNYRSGISNDYHRRKDTRQLLTLRLTKLLLKQNLSLSLFSYFSPTDSDFCLRPRISYKISDIWTVETGGNIFYGRHNYTFWGQFDKNTNIFFSIRRYFSY